MKQLCLVLLATCLCMTPVLATEPAPAASTLDIIRQEQLALQAEIGAGKTEGLTPRQVNAIRKSQTEVFALIEGKSSLDALAIDEKIRLENALESINAQVKGGRKGRDEQDVCWREAKTGSQTKVTRCGTEAERDQVRRDAREFLEKPRICAGDCGAGG